VHIRVDAGRAARAHLFTLALRRAARTHSVALALMPGHSCLGTLRNCSLTSIANESLDHKSPHTLLPCCVCLDMCHSMNMSHSMDMCHFICHSMCHCMYMCDCMHYSDMCHSLHEYVSFYAGVCIGVIGCSIGYL